MVLGDNVIKQYRGNLRQYFYPRKGLKFNSKLRQNCFKNSVFKFKVNSYCIF
jgi:hypothetical protein